MKTFAVAIILSCAASVNLLAAESGEQQPSSACLTCHSGSGGPDIPAYGSHPFSIDYERSMMLFPGRYKPSSSPSGLGRSIAEDLLLDGKVECTSCHTSHDVDSDQKFRLRTATTETGLCIACHDMRNI